MTSTDPSGLDEYNSTVPHGSVSRRDFLGQDAGPAPWSVFKGAEQRQQAIVAAAVRQLIDQLAVYLVLAEGGGSDKTFAEFVADGDYFKLVGEAIATQRKRAWQATLPQVGPRPEESAYERRRNERWIQEDRVEWAFSQKAIDSGDKAAARLRIDACNRAGGMINPYLPAPKEDIHFVLRNFFGSIPGPSLVALPVDSAYCAGHGDYAEAAESATIAALEIVLLRFGDKIFFDDVAPNRGVAGATHNLGGSGLIDDGLPIRNLNVNRIKVTDRGIGVVENHLSRFGSHPHNEAMLARLRRISRGEIQAMAEDLNYYSHELREFVRMRNLGVGPDDFLKMDVNSARRIYESTHNATLLDYGIPQGMEETMLYHPFARQFIGRPW